MRPGRIEGVLMAWFVSWSFEVIREAVLAVDTMGMPYSRDALPSFKVDVLNVAEAPPLTGGSDDAFCAGW